MLDCGDITAPVNVRGCVSQRRLPTGENPHPGDTKATGALGACSEPNAAR